MESSGWCRRRRFRGIAVEGLEGRLLLSTLEIQPMGVHAVPAHTQQAQTRSANAGDALHVGGQYAKAVFSPATGTVISNYTKALLSGNGKELKSLGNSSAAQQLDASFKSATSSTQAQAIGSSFKKLGHSISNEFKKIFD